MMPQIYKSTDPNAPVLTGQVGSLIGVFRACLVDGYGVGGNHKNGAGWTLPFTGTSTIQVFRNDVSDGASGGYLRLDDGGSGPGGFKEAVLHGYTTMSDRDTGTDEIPKTPQVGSGPGACFRKSHTEDSTAVPWMLIADNKTFYIQVHVAGDANPDQTYGFGDFNSEIVNDQFNFFITSRLQFNSSGLNGSSFITGPGPSQAAIVDFGMYILRGKDLLTTSQLAGFNTAGGNAIQDTSPRPEHLFNYPSDYTGKVYFAPKLVTGDGILRGFARGVYGCLNNVTDVVAFPTGLQITNIPGLDNAVLNVMTTSAGSGQAVWFIDTGNEW